MSKTRYIANIDDARLTTTGLVLKHHKSFIRYFLHPGIQSIRDAYETWRADDDVITIEARVKLSHQSKYGEEQIYYISIEDFECWKGNIGLFSFVDTKKAAQLLPKE